MRLIREALSVLPRHQREVVELVAWSELTLDEAAGVLGISIGTVKSRLAQARARLVGDPVHPAVGRAPMNLVLPPDRRLEDGDAMLDRIA